MSQKSQWPLKRLVEVEWRDSCSHGGWNTVENHRKRCAVGPCRSIGYIMSDADRMLTLAQSQSAVNQDVTDIIAIPREAVVKIRRLKGGC
jgi:hypothetical protein